MISRFLIKRWGKCDFGMGSKVSLIKEKSLIKDSGQIETSIMNLQTVAKPETRVHGPPVMVTGCGDFSAGRHLHVSIILTS
jgi:hypothetical protein